MKWDTLVVLVLMAMTAVVVALHCKAQEMRARVAVLGAKVQVEKNRGDWMEYWIEKQMAYDGCSASQRTVCEPLE